MTALLTGAGGFTGLHLAAHLRERGLDVTGLLWPQEPTAPGQVRVDVRDAATVRHAVHEAGPTAVFHLAGQVRGAPGDIHTTNVLGTVNVLEAVRHEAPGAAVVVIGSAAEYGAVDCAGRGPITEDEPCRPVGPYGVSKHAATLVALDYASQYDLDVMVVRPFNLIGAGVPPSLLVGALLQRIQAAPTASITVGNVDAARDFVSVTDAVRAYADLAATPRRGEIFNVCSGVATPVRELLDTIRDVVGRPITFEPDPELFRAHDPAVIYGSHAKLTDATGFRPRVSLADSVAAAWDAITANGNTGSTG